MSVNRSLNEGTLDRTPIVIKCAKSVRAPLTVSKTTLERVNEVWAVFLTSTDAGEVWRLSASDFKQAASFYSPRNGVPHYSIRYKRIKARAELVGIIPEKDVARCEIP
jgi:hypothetical protein